MPLHIIRNDISKVKADAIVNTANPMVAVGAGVDQTIYEAAGWDQLLAEREKIGPMEPGQAAATPAFALDARYIIHTVGPLWRGGDFGERQAVASCYRKSLEIASQLGCESIAFPLISTGTYGFPKDEALRIAIDEISGFLFSHDMTVYMVVYDREAFVISSKAFSDIRTYIEEKDVKPRAARGSRRAAEYYGSYDVSNTSVLVRKGREERRRRRRKAEEPSDQVMMSPLPEASADDLDQLLDRDTDTFQQMLFRLIDRKGMTDPEVYKKANIDRKLFSKIRGNAQYVPSKKTVLALAVALELNMDETIDLLQRAGLALSPSSRFDLIVGYCINHKIYNIFEINTYLFEYDQPLLVG